jgi:hypothetical protein
VNATVGIDVGGVSLGADHASLEESATSVETFPIVTEWAVMPVKSLKAEAGIGWGVAASAPLAQSQLKAREASVTASTAACPTRLLPLQPDLWRMVPPDLSAPAPGLATAPQTLGTYNDPGRSGRTRTVPCTFAS